MYTLSSFFDKTFHPVEKVDHSFSEMLWYFLIHDGSRRYLLIDERNECNRMMDMREFMTLMHCKRLTVYRWRKQGKIPSVVVGRKVLFKRSDVELFLNANTLNKGDRSEAGLACQ
jgi:excisionase family DNA binding protein